MKPLSLTLSVATLITATVPAQDLIPKAAPQKQPIVIRGATLHTMDGEPLVGGSILFDKGVITAVLARGADVKIPANAQIIDARGKHVYPGFISAHTMVGLVEISAVRATRDHTEVGQVKPELRAAVAVNPDSTVIPVTRANGVLTVGVFSQGGLVSGRAAVMNLDGWTWEDMAVEPDAGLIVNWPSLRIRRGRWSSTILAEKRELVLAARREIQQTLDAARAYVQAKKNDPSLRTDLRWEAMRATLEGRRPVFLRADEMEQIESAVAWAQKNRLRPVIIGGRDAANCFAVLKRHDVPVIVTGTYRLPQRRDLAFDEPFTLPKRLEELGLRWCLASTNEFYNERNLPYHAAKAVAHGLQRDRAVQAITTSAAEILGVGKRIGSLTKGKDATLFVCDGDPLEVTGTIERAFIRGRKIDLRSKHTQLADKYRQKYRQLGLTKDAKRK